MPVLYAVLVPPRSGSPRPPPKARSPPKPKSTARRIVKAGLIASLLAAAGATAVFPRQIRNGTFSAVYGPRSIHDARLSNIQKLALGHPLRGLRTYAPPKNHSQFHHNGKGGYVQRSKTLGRQLADNGGENFNYTVQSPNAKKHARVEALVKANRLATRTTSTSYSLSGELASVFNKVALCKSTQVFADDASVVTRNYFFQQGMYNFLIDADRVAKSGRVRGTYAGNAYSQMNPYLPQCGMKTSKHTWQELANHVRKTGKKNHDLAMSEAVMDLNEKDILGLLVNLDKITQKNSATAAWNEIRVAIGSTNFVARKFKKTNPLRNIYIFSPKTNKLKLIRDKAHFAEYFEYYRLRGPLV